MEVAVVVDVQVGLPTERQLPAGLDLGDLADEVDAQPEVGHAAPSEHGERPRAEVHGGTRFDDLRPSGLERHHLPAGMGDDECPVRRPAVGDEHLPALEADLQVAPRDLVAVSVTGRRPWRSGSLSRSGRRPMSSSWSSSTTWPSSSCRRPRLGRGTCSTDDEPGARNSPHTPHVAAAGGLGWPLPHILASTSVPRLSAGSRSGTTSRSSETRRRQRDVGIVGVGDVSGFRLGCWDGGGRPRLLQGLAVGADGGRLDGGQGRCRIVGVDGLRRASGGRRRRLDRRRRGELGHRLRGRASAACLGHAGRLGCRRRRSLGWRGGAHELEPEAAGEDDTAGEIGRGVDVAGAADLDHGVTVQRQRVLDPCARAGAGEHRQRRLVGLHGDVAERHHLDRRIPTPGRRTARP